MRLYILLFTVFVYFILEINCEHLLLGRYDSEGNIIAREKIKYKAIPFLKRVKQYFFSSSDGKIIQSIIAYDNFNSKASINVTAGGVGYSFVNLRLKSERGVGLDYDVGIYG